MKKSYICLVIIVFVCFCVFAYSLEYSNKYKNSRMAEDKSIEEASTEDKTETEEYSNCPFTEEELEQTLKTVIEDDIWFKDKASIFYHCINQKVEYEYKYTEFGYSDGGYVTILPLIEPNNNLSLYYIISLEVYNGKLRDGVSYSGMQNLEKVRSLFIPEATGVGAVNIGERRRPPYDADAEDVEQAKENILRWLDTRSHIGGGSNIEDVYIRNFYKTSIETIMFYTYEGERYCRSVYLSGQEGDKPVFVDSMDSDYVDRMLECSFPLGEVPTLDEETEQTLKRMIEEKTEQTLKTAIEDDIWFGYEKSIFYPYINQDIQYEYYYEYYYREEHGYIRVLPLIKPDSQSLYYILGFRIDDNILNHISYYSGENLDELKAEHNMPEILGRGTVSIGERREPPYDADEADIEEAKENIRKELEKERKIGSWMQEAPDNDDEIYIKNFYKDSIDTVMLYTYKGEQYYIDIYLDGRRNTTPNAVEEAQKEYYNRMLKECFPLYE